MIDNGGCSVSYMDSIEGRDCSNLDECFCLAWIWVYIVSVIMEIL